MTLVHHYSTPTTPAGVGSDTVITTSVQLVEEKGFSARASLGEADIVKVVVDDPLGVYDFKGLKRWYMVETDCPAINQLVWNGYVGHQRISRGSGSSTLFPFGRRWSLDLVQENTILGFRIVTGTDGNRPAEAVTARLTWLLVSPYLSTVVDHGLIVASTLPMDAVDYRGQTAKDVLGDLALATGFNYYARYHEASGDIQLAFYDPNVSLLDASTLRISNVPADVDYTLTWPPFEDAELDRSPDSVAAGIYLPYSGGSVYDYRLATSYEFGFRDMAAPSANVKTAAKANALLARLLRQHSTQDEQITGVRLRLPSANLNDVKHGQLVNAKFSHLPGYEDFRKMRVVSKVFSRPDNLTQAAYDVDLDLSPATPDAVEQFGTLANGPATDCGPFRWDLPPGGGNLLVGFIAVRGSPGIGSANIVPIGSTIFLSCSFLYDIAGTEWNYVTGFDVNTGVGPGFVGYPIVLAWRDSVVNEPQNIHWNSTGGSSRTRNHQVEISGLSGAPTVTATSASQSTSGSVFSSPNIVAPGPGYIFAGFSYTASGPSDGASAAFVMAARSPAVDLTSGYGEGAFAPYSWFGYIRVEEAGTYSIVLDRSVEPRNPTYGYGWIMGFWPL